MPPGPRSARPGLPRSRSADVQPLSERAATFRRQRAPLSGEPSVTIQKRGTFSINVHAYQALESPEAVELLYDRNERILGLRKVDPQSEFAYLVRPLGKGNSTWLISGMAFTAHYGIPTQHAHRWDGRLEDNVLMFDLKQPGVEVTAGRKQPGGELTSARLCHLRRCDLTTTTCRASRAAPRVHADVQPSI